MAKNARRRPRQARSKATVEAILEATAQVLVEDGYDAASTNRIAKRAGVSVGSLYQYFPNKASLVEALAELHLERMVSILAESFDGRQALSIPEIARVQVSALVRAHQVNPELHRVLIEQAPVAALGTARRAAEALLRADMERRAALGENRIADPELSAFLVVALVDAAITEALSRPHLLDGERLVNGLTEMILRYCLPVHD